jgi:hypothetical protein
MGRLGPRPDKPARQFRGTRSAMPRGRGRVITGRLPRACLGGKPALTQVVGGDRNAARVPIHDANGDDPWDALIGARFT